MRPARPADQPTTERSEGVGWVSGTISATGWGWASRPAKRNENRWDWSECGAGSGEIEMNHGAIEAEQLCDPERA